MNTSISTIYVDSTFFYYLSKEIKISRIFRRQLKQKYKTSKFKFLLLPTQSDLIDYKWNYRVTEMVRERCELDHALSWLSTLGGAFSALGDYFSECAQTAGRISMNQFKLALRLGDPTIAARCRLYFSLSLIQQKRFEFARHIISQEYEIAKESVIVDHRLLRMCLGIWAKLQYEYSLYKIEQKLKRITVS